MPEDSARVVSLRGGEIQPPGEVRPNVVELAEEILERARSGEIMGLSAVLHHSDEACSFRHVGPTDFRVLGCLETLKAWIIQQINGEGA